MRDGALSGLSLRYRSAAGESKPKLGNRVRIVHLPSGEPVKDAIISKGQLEMPMLQSGYRINLSGLSLGDAYVKYLGSDAEGTYRFRGDVSWLKIRARVPGEAESIRGAATFEAVS